MITEAQTRKVKRLTDRIRRLRHILKAPTAPAALIARPHGHGRVAHKRRVRDLIAAERQLQDVLNEITGEKTDETDT